MDSSSTSEDSQSWREGESNFSSSTSDSEQLSTSSSQSQDQNILTAQKIENNKRLYYDIVSVRDESKICKVSDCQKTFATLNNLIRHCHIAHKKSATHAIHLARRMQYHAAPEAATVDASPHSGTEQGNLAIRRRSIYYLLILAK